MNDALRLVKSGWYHSYWSLMMGVSLAVLLLYSLRAADAPEGLTQLFGISSTATIIALGQAGYSVSLYWWLRRMRQPLALAVASMPSALLLLYLIGHAAPSGKWLVTGVWIATTFLAGMYGLALLLGSLLITTLFVLLRTDYQLTQITAQDWALLLGSTLAVIFGHMFWRTRYLRPQDQQLSKLSGLLRNKQEQSLTLMQSLTDGVIVTDTEGKITLINPAAAKLTGWDMADAGGVDARLVAKLTNEKGEALANENNPFANVLTQKKPTSQTVHMVARAGDQHVVSLAVSPVMADATMTGSVAVIRDVSRDYAAEQQRAEFISTASHEMRTPVAAIEGYLALALNEKVSTIDSRARGFLEKAHASTQHLGKLFQDLLTSAKAEDGRLSSHPVVVEMGSFMEQLVEDLRLSAQKKGLLAEFVVGESQTIDATHASSGLKMVKPLYYAHADPDRLREVLTNLFDNAVKYTDQGKITLGLAGDENVVQMYVSDTGAGIPADDIPHLFQKFYRVDSSATRVVGGTGLGLFICRKIVELYHGRIWVQSQLGKGSTFYINLPRLTTQRAEQLQAAESSRPVSLS